MTPPAKNKKKQQKPATTTAVVATTTVSTAPAPTLVKVPAKHKRDGTAVAARADGQKKKNAAATKAPAKMDEEEMSGSDDSDDESDSDADDSSNDEDEDDDEDDDDNIVDVEFDFFSLVETDYHAVKRFLTQALGADAGDHLSGLVDLTDHMLAAPIGSTVKCDGESSDPYAVTTLVGLSGSTWAAHRATKPLAAFLSKKIKDKRFASLLEKSRVAWLVHERLINVPWQVAAPLHRLLVDEIKEVDGEEYEFEYVVVLCPMYSADDADDEEEQPEEEEEEDAAAVKKRRIQAMLRGGKGAAAAAAAKKRRVKKPAAATLTSYTYLEQEYMEKHAEWSTNVTLAVAGDPEATAGSVGPSGSMRATRKALVIKASKLPKIVEELEELVAQSEALIRQERVFE
ncbi:Mss4p nuclear export [Allomyces arbusculus]|nr:Mss4p nuclear export [Allomyces arbusculus]